VKLELEVLDDADAAARRVGEVVADRARRHGGATPFSLALSKAPPALLAALAGLPWSHVGVYQADERVARAGDPERNLTQILAGLPTAAHASVHPMPVDETDVDSAAQRYASELPHPLDLVHLGLGADGHTASLVPRDPVLEVRDRLVAVTREHEGFRRMTVTYPVLDVARELVWLVTGEAKRDALARLLAGDRSLVAARIWNAQQLVVADVAAAGA
jgi:6-phosphogluconolactonase